MTAAQLGDLHDKFTMSEVSFLKKPFVLPEVAVQLQCGVMC
jgi:hypothetical protein